MSDHPSHRPGTPGEPPDPQIGKSYGHYQVVSLLGKGGMGAVYLAEQPRIGKRVAIKVLHPHVAKVPEALRRFFHEARLVNQIHNANLIDIFDFGEDEEGVPYLVMEMLEGESLKTRLQRGPLQESEARHIGVQVARALDAAHAIDVVHRDLKPDNIFLCQRGEDDSFVKILDFGIAKLLSDEGAKEKLTRDGAVLGTPLYMAPEQVRGTGIGPGTDIYAVGCMLYEMVSGRPPFEGNMLALINAHLNETPPRLSTLGVQVSLDYDRITQTCLAKAPEARFARAIDLAEGLARTELARTRQPGLTPPPPLEAPAAGHVHTPARNDEPAGSATAGVVPRVERSAMRMNAISEAMASTMGASASAMAAAAATPPPSGAMEPLAEARSTVSPPRSPGAAKAAAPARSEVPPARPSTVPPTRALQAEEVRRPTVTARVASRGLPLGWMGLGIGVLVAVGAIIVALTRGAPPAPTPTPAPAPLPGTSVTAPEGHLSPPPRAGMENPPPAVERPLGTPRGPAPPPGPASLGTVGPGPAAPPAPSPIQGGARLAIPSPAGPTLTPPASAVRTHWTLISSSCPNVFAPHITVHGWGAQVLITSPGYTTMHGTVTPQGAYTVSTPGALCHGQVVGGFSSQVCAIGALRCAASYRLGH